MANTLHGWRNSAAASQDQNLPSLRFKAIDKGNHIVVPVGAPEEYGYVLPVGTQIIPDIGHYYEGEMRWQPFDDSRMRPYGTPLPAFSGETGYAGGLKIQVMIQRHGLAVLQSTSEAVARAISAIMDAAQFAPEGIAGKLPVYEIGEPRSYKSKHRPDLLYAPVYILRGWVERSTQGFGPRLVPPPKPMLISEPQFAPKVLPSDELFNTATPHAEVLPPTKVLPAQKPSKKKAKQEEHGPQFDPDLNDVISF
jgi:hypothetical protein